MRHARHTSLAAMWRQPPTDSQTDGWPTDAASVAIQERRRRARRAASGLAETLNPKLR
jgi:hypothetical protein